MKTMIKALIVVALVSKGLCAAEATLALTDNQGYDFVSQKLLYNKTNAEQAKPEARGCMGTLVREAAFIAPSVIAGYLTAFIFSAVCTGDASRPAADLTPVITIFLGTFVLGPIASLGYYGTAKLIASYWNTKPIALPTLQEFVKNWNIYKNNVPAELHKEFDVLYFNYLKNQGKLVLDEDRAKEILNRVLTLCVQQSETIQYKNSFAVGR